MTTVGDVIDGLKSIKPGKQDGNYGLTSDHLINSSNKFKIVLNQNQNQNNLYSTHAVAVNKILLYSFKYGNSI